MRLNTEALKVIRERSGHSIASLAAEAQISRPHLSNIESGARTASPDAILKLARALKIPVTAVLLDPEAAGAVA